MITKRLGDGRYQLCLKGLAVNITRQDQREWRTEPVWDRRVAYVVASLWEAKQAAAGLVNLRLKRQA